jgi:hypothetical protein
MTNPSPIEVLANMSQALTPEEAEPYKAVFGDLYWWGTPEYPTIPDALGNLRANRNGAIILNAFQVYDDGMVRLSDPVAREVSVIDARKLRIGCFVKLAIENLLRFQGPRQEEGESYRVLQRDNGFTVSRINSSSNSLYSYASGWYMVSDTDKGHALFPLVIDYSASYSATIGIDYTPAIKVTAANHKKGVTEIPVNQTLYRYLKRNCTFYQRVRSATIHHPRVAPQRIPIIIDPDNFKMT